MLMRGGMTWDNSGLEAGLAKANRAIDAFAQKANQKLNSIRGAAAMSVATPGKGALAPIMGQFVGLPQAFNASNAAATKYMDTLNKMSGIFTSGMGISVAIGGLASLTAAFSRGIKTAREYQVSTLAIAGGIGSAYKRVDAAGKEIKGPATFMRNLADATKIQKEILRRSAVNVLTFQEQLQAYQSALQPGARKGLDIKQIEKLSERGAVVAKVLGLRGEQLAHATRLMLGGGVNVSRSTIGQALGIKNEDIASRSGVRLEKFLSERMQGFIAAEKAFEKSIEGRLTTFETKVDVTVAKIGARFIDNIADDLEKFGALVEPVQEQGESKESFQKRLAEYTKAQDELNNIIDSASEAFTAMFDAVKNIISSAPFKAFIGFLQQISKYAGTAVLAAGFLTAAKAIKTAKDALVAFIGVTKTLGATNLMGAGIGGTGVGGVAGAYGLSAAGAAKILGKGPRVNPALIYAQALGLSAVPTMPTVARGLSVGTATAAGGSLLAGAGAARFGAKGAWNPASFISGSRGVKPSDVTDALLISMMAGGKQKEALTLLKGKENLARKAALKKAMKDLQYADYNRYQGIMSSSSAKIAEIQEKLSHAAVTAPKSVSRLETQLQKEMMKMQAAQVGIMGLSSAQLPMITRTGGKIALPRLAAAGRGMVGRAGTSAVGAAVGQGISMLSSDSENSSVRMGGAIVGNALTGAAIGSLIAPGIGTAVGAIVGAAISPFKVMADDAAKNLRDTLNREKDQEAEFPLATRIAKNNRDIKRLEREIKKGTKQVDRADVATGTLKTALAIEKFIFPLAEDNRNIKASVKLTEEELKLKKHKLDLLKSENEGLKAQGTLQKRIQSFDDELKKLDARGQLFSSLGFSTESSDILRNIKDRQGRITVEKAVDEETITTDEAKLLKRDIGIRTEVETKQRALQKKAAMQIAMGNAKKASLFQFQEQVIGQAGMFSGTQSAEFKKFQENFQKQFIKSLKKEYDVTQLNIRKEIISQREAKTQKEILLEERKRMPIERERAREEQGIRERSAGRQYAEAVDQKRLIYGSIGVLSPMIQAIQSSVDLEFVKGFDPEKYRAAYYRSRQRQFAEVEDSIALSGINLERVKEETGDFDTKWKRAFEGNTNALESLTIQQQNSLLTLKEWQEAQRENAEILKSFSVKLETQLASIQDFDFSFGKNWEDESGKTPTKNKTASLPGSKQKQSHSINVPVTVNITTSSDMNTLEKVLPEKIKTEIEKLCKSMERTPK